MSMAGYFSVPIRSLQRFGSGASYITFHPEATNHVDRSLSLVRAAGCKSGLVFNPSTSLDYLKYVMDKVDIILLMSVNPGFGGQKFIPNVLDKAREARRMIDESVSPHPLVSTNCIRARRGALERLMPHRDLHQIVIARASSSEGRRRRAQGFDIRLEIDGGVTVDNIKDVAEAGVDFFVAGSAILKAPRTQDAYRCAKEGAEGRRARGSSESGRGRAWGGRRAETARRNRGLPCLVGRAD
jgi:ribulose-phosphate 3-epimerase